jgi:hypothetical protein
MELVVMILGKLSEFRDVGYILAITAIYLYYKRPTQCAQHYQIVMVLSDLRQHQVWTINQMIRLCKKMDVDIGPLPPIPDPGAVECAKIRNF